MLSWTSSSPRGSSFGPGVGDQGAGNPWAWGQELDVQELEVRELEVKEPEVQNHKGPGAEGQGEGDQKI